MPSDVLLMRGHILLYYPWSVPSDVSTTRLPPYQSRSVHAMASCGIHVFVEVYDLMRIDSVYHLGRHEGPRRVAVPNSSRLHQIQSEVQEYRPSKWANLFLFARTILMQTAPPCEPSDVSLTKLPSCYVTRCPCND